MSLGNGHLVLDNEVVSLLGDVLHEGLVGKASSSLEGLGQSNLTISPVLSGSHFIEGTLGGIIPQMLAASSTIGPLSLGALHQKTDLGSSAHELAQDGRMGSIVSSVQDVLKGSLV